MVTTDKQDEWSADNVKKVDTNENTDLINKLIELSGSKEMRLMVWREVEAITKNNPANNDQAAAFFHQIKALVRLAKK